MTKATKPHPKEKLRLFRRKGVWRVYAYIPHVYIQQGQFWFTSQDKGYSTPLEAWENFNG